MNFNELPQTQNYRWIPFDTAKVKTHEGARLLVVTGEAPCANIPCGA